MTTNPAGAINTNDVDQIVKEFGEKENEYYKQWYPKYVEYVSSHTFQGDPLPMVVKYFEDLTRQCAEIYNSSIDDADQRHDLLYKIARKTYALSNNKIVSVDLDKYCIVQGAIVRKFVQQYPWQQTQPEEILIDYVDDAYVEALNRFKHSCVIDNHPIKLEYCLIHKNKMYDTVKLPMAAPKEPETDMLTKLFALKTSYEQVINQRKKKFIETRLFTGSLINEFVTMVERETKQAIKNQKNGSIVRKDLLLDFVSMLKTRTFYLCGGQFWEQGCNAEDIEYVNEGHIKAPSHRHGIFLNYVSVEQQKEFEEFLSKAYPLAEDRPSFIYPVYNDVEEILRDL